MNEFLQMELDGESFRFGMWLGLFVGIVIMFCIQMIAMIRRKSMIDREVQKAMEKIRKKLPPVMPVPIVVERTPLGMVITAPQGVPLPPPQVLMAIIEKMSISGQSDAGQSYDDVVADMLRQWKQAQGPDDEDNMEEDPPFDPETN